MVAWKEVDEGWIRYDQQSGNTQLLSRLARFIIDSIDENPEPFSPEAIVDMVLDAEPEANPADCHVEVDSALRILSEAQLIEPFQR